MFLQQLNSRNLAKVLVKQNVSQIGLGLAFCKIAVEAQGGTLAIAPNQPQGSIFTVEI